MLHALSELVAGAALPRATLLVNHVLAAEPAAADRLKRHAGRQLRLQLNGWPDLLPALPALRFAITPAGLLEWQPADDAAPADLEIAVDTANPARTLAQSLLGRRPQVLVTGDAALAADVSWVIDNLRWDVRDDLSRLVGELPARELARTARAAATGLRDFVQGLVRRAAPHDSAFAAGTAHGVTPAEPAPPPAR